MKNFKLFIICILCMVFMAGCYTAKPSGEPGENTITLNLSSDGVVGDIFVTHVNGVATGAKIIPSGNHNIPDKKTYVNPVYVPLDGKPIELTILCPVYTGQTHPDGTPFYPYKRTTIKFTELADVKAGDIIILQWAYKTKLFSFQNVKGENIQQVAPTFPSNWLGM